MTTKAQHTPGPWILSGCGWERKWTLGSVHFNPCVSTSVESRQPAICEVFARANDDDSDRLEETKANARLIAAAPDMAEALICLTKEIHLSELNIRKDFSLINAHAAALKALRKAGVA